MKKILVILLLQLAIGNLVQAQSSAPGVIVHKTDGTKEQIEISAIRSIKFSDDQMTINKTAGGKITYALDDITSLAFSNVASAINAITDNNDNATLTITDLNGRMIYSGSKSNFTQALHGLYIINGHKVAIQ